MKGRVLDERSSSGGAVRLLLECVTTAELEEALAAVFGEEPGVTYTILLWDSEAAALSVYTGGAETRRAKLPEPARTVLAGLLETGDGRITILSERVTLSRGPEVRAAASLAFRGDNYGLFLIHGRDSDANRWQGVVDVLAATIVKVQLYEAANQESATSRAKLEALTEAGALVKYVDLDELLAKLMETSVGIMNAQVGAIVFAEGDRFRTQVEWGLTEAFLTSLKTREGEGFLRTVLEGAEPVLIDNVNTSELIDPRALEVDLRSILAIPLVTQSRKLGLIVIVNSGSGELHRDDFEVLSTIANLSASAVESAILCKEAIQLERISAEMNLASNVQAALLPKTAPKLERIELAGWNLCCTETGGDYFDYIDIGGGSTAVVVGDATGHGMGAALMMFVTRSTLRALLTQTQNLVEVVTKMNDLIEASSEPGRFMTLFLGVVDRDAKKLVYASAGHDGPIVYRAGVEAVIDDQSTGVPLGILAGSKYESREVALRSGDFWLFGTDGIWEARNPKGEFYGKGRLRRLVREMRELPLEEASRRVREDVLAFHEGAPPCDDITAVLLRVK
jgi:sigma-B regulation protein RsbU (phosphoserine phosphatase)